ncbi:hypothetical protein PQX77_006081 [Marasmius sp. AFHP31]|nr:hypothetical protein PQX77_006081 [Marasmius sp. AFHP31]
MFDHSDSPRISVSGGTLSFNIVHGNQSNPHTQSPQDRHRFPPGEEWKEELYHEVLIDHYERIPTGRIKLINTISETGVERRTYEEPRTMSLVEGSDTSRAKRVLHLACTVSETRVSPPSLVVKYTGRDARHAFKMDVLQFSQLRDPAFPQLRGFNDSEMPMIIFHDLLVPARHVIEYTQNSPIALCYLHMQGNAAVSNLPPTAAPIMLSLCSTPGLLYGEHIWIRPQTGDVCFGPAGPWPDHNFSIWGYPTSPQHAHLGPSPLPLSAYNNSALFDYLVQNATSDFVLSVLSRQYMWPYPDEMDCCQHILHVHSHFHQQPVAKFPGSTGTFTFHCILYEPHHLESEPAKMLMEDGRTRYIAYLTSPAGFLNLLLTLRLTISNHYIEQGSLLFHFRQDRTLYSFCEAWLCQAIHVFHVLGIPREEWEGFTLLPNHSITVLGLCSYGYAQSRRNYDYRSDPPYYLFVQPPPQLPDTTPDLVSWTQAPAESLYYWSVDPDGNSRMSKAHYMTLGLPCFRNFANQPHVGWKAEIYDLVRQWQEAKGFDPTTTVFARSMGYPIVEILDQDGHRLELCSKHGEGSDLMHEHGLEPMQVDEFFETIPNSQDSPTLPREGFEENSSMDADIENCGNRMPQLRVETDIMDET